MTCYPWAAPIREVASISADDFEEIRESNQPVVVRGIADDWPAVREARKSDEDFVDYLKRFCTESRVPAIMGEPEIGGRFFYNEDVTEFNFQRGVTPLNRFLDRLLRDRENAAPHALAVQSEYVDELLPGFEVENRLSVLDHVRPRAWIGNRIRVAPHYDLYENAGVVVAGRRRFTVFPPEQLQNLYVGPFELTPAGTPVSMVDPANPDLERFPRFAEAMKVAQCAILEPGDGIYIPYHWWHGVDSLEPINLFINYWWDDAAKGGGSPYDALMYAFFAFKILPQKRREVWRHVFDHYVFQVNGDPAEHLPEPARGILGSHSPELMERIRRTIKTILDSI